MTREITLKSVYPDFIENGGILTELTNNSTDYPEIPWRESASGDILDLEYYANRSGNKLISPVIEELITEDGLTDAAKKKLAKLAYTRYGLKWKKQWATLNLEYNPIENYDRQEDWVDKHLGKDTLTDTIAKRKQSQAMAKRKQTQTMAKRKQTQTMASISNSDTYGAQSNSSTVGGGTDTHEHQVSGFNSSDYTKGEKDTDIIAQRSNSESIGSHTDSHTIGGHTDTFENDGYADTFENDGYTDIFENDAYTDSHEQAYQSREKHIGRVHGNIGVTTSQQMIQSERDLWNWEFFTMVFDDIDNLLTIPYYGSHCDKHIKFEPSHYILPQATSTKLGGVKADAKDATDTQPVHIGSDGKLYTKAGGGSYELPIASQTQLGGVKIGENVHIDSNGKISVNVPQKTSDLTNDSGFITDADIPTKTSDLVNDSGFVDNDDLQVVDDKATGAQQTASTALQSASDAMDYAEGVADDLADAVEDIQRVESMIPTKTSELTNDAEFITADDIPAATSTVAGAVKADAKQSTDTQAVRIGTDGKLYTAPGSGQYVLPPATNSSLGGVMIGTDLIIEENGTLNNPVASSTSKGVVKVSDSSRGDGVYPDTIAKISNTTLRTYDGSYTDEPVLHLVNVREFVTVDDLVWPWTYEYDSTDAITAFPTRAIPTLSDLVTAVIYKDGVYNAIYYGNNIHTYYPDAKLLTNISPKTPSTPTNKYESFLWELATRVRGVNNDTNIIYVDGGLVQKIFSYKNYVVYAWEDCSRHGSDSHIIGIAIIGSTSTSPASGDLYGMTIKAEVSVNAILPDDMTNVNKYLIPAPTTLTNGGIKASARNASVDTVEAKLGTDGKLYVKPTEVDIISDSTISTSKTWSSSKLDDIIGDIEDLLATL